MNRRVALGVLVAMVLLVGTVSATTVYLNPVEDGYIRVSSANSTFHNLYISSGSTAYDTSPAYIGWAADTMEDRYVRIYRGGMTFNTTTIPAEYSIISAKLSLNGTGASKPTNGSLVLLNWTPANKLAMVATDFANAKWDTTPLAANITATDWSNTSLNNFTLTSTSVINKGGYTTLGTRYSEDLDDSPSYWSSGVSQYFRYEITAGTTKPILEIVYESSDTTPPTAATISNSTTCHMINWTFSYSEDVNIVEVYKDNTFYENVTSPATTSLFHNLTPGSSYTVSTKTVDAAENINDTWSNQTATALATCPTWPKILFTFDDASESVYQNASPILETYNYNATLYVVSDYAERGVDEGFMNTTQLTELHNAGWDTANHGFNHTSLSEESTVLQKAIIQEGQQYLESLGFTREMYHFAYPYGHYNDQVISSAASVGTLTARTTVSGHYLTTPKTTNLLNFSSTVYPYGDTVSPATIEAWISGGTTNQSVVLIFHEIKDPAAQYSYTPSNFTSLVNWIYDYGYQPITISEWYTLNTFTPVASFTTNVTSGAVPLAVGFTDSSSNTPTSWNWSFGDGNWSNGTSSTALHLYESIGTFNAFLIASNGGGSSQSASTAITVNAPTTAIQCQNQTGNITISLFSNSTTSLGWTWGDPGNITKIAEDGLYVLAFDNSSDYFIGTGYSPESWHKLKIYNETDFGQLNCTTDAIPIVPTPIPIMPGTETNVDPANLFSYWPYALIALGVLVVMRK